MIDISEEGLKKLPAEMRLPVVMEALDAIIPLIEVDELRSLVAKGEAFIGRSGPPLPSGQPFDKQTRKGRLYLDLIDDLKQLDEEYP